MMTFNNPKLVVFRISLAHPSIIDRVLQSHPFKRWNLLENASGKHTKNGGKSPCFSWVNQRTQ